MISPRTQARQVFLLLLFGAVFFQAPAHQRVIHAHDNRARGIDLADFLHGQHVAYRVEAGAAVFGAHHHAHEAQLAHFLDLGGGKFLVLVALNHAGPQLALGKVAGGIAHGQLLFGELINIRGSGGLHGGGGSWFSVQKYVPNGC